MQTHIVVDTTRATLSDLVEGILKSQLGYDECSIKNEKGLIYDVDFDDNLFKKFDELGISGDTFLTVVDEASDSPKLDLSLAVVEK